MFCLPRLDTNLKFLTLSSISKSPKHQIFTNGAHLSLLRSKICILKLYGSPMKLNQCCELKVLDLGHCNADYQVLTELLTSCHSLEKLSMKGFTFNSKIIEAFSLKNGKTLKVLDLSSCKGLVLESIQLIVRNCLELKELNLEYTKLSNESISLLSNKLTTKVSSIFSVFKLSNTEIIFLAGPDTFRSH